MKGFILLLSLLAISACEYQTAFPDRFTDGIYSNINEELFTLPEPRGKVSVSVYSFRDKTGQYKPASENQLSTAVTQGASSMLISALNKSGWFSVHEREGLQNLLTERKLISATRRKLPKLSTSNLMLEGGIIAYESNVRTGGEAASYFGIGVGEQYRVDMVVVSLRAIDVYTGEIVAQVNSQEKILSREVRAGLVRFLKEPKLLELEGGYSYSEPRVLCVNSAIEKAVLKLISVGVKQGLWKTRDANEMSSEIWDKVYL